MSYTVQHLIQKNKEAYDKACLIESLYMSHILINKALKQVIKEEYTQFKTTGRYKISQLIKVLEEAYKVSPRIKVKLRKNVFNEIILFNDQFKTVSKELRFQYPESKIKTAATLGIKVTVMLNTTLSRIKNNSREN